MSLATAATKLNTHRHVDSDSPLGHLQILCDGSDGAVGCRRVCNQPFGGIGAIRFVFGFNPFSAGIARRRLAGEPEPAFGRALEKCFEQRSG